MRPIFTTVQWDSSAHKAQGNGMLVSLPLLARAGGGHYLYATPCRWWCTMCYGFPFTAHTPGVKRRKGASIAHIKQIEQQGF